MLALVYFIGVFAISLCEAFEVVSGPVALWSGLGIHLAGALGYYWRYVMRNTQPEVMKEFLKLKQSIGGTVEQIDGSCGQLSEAIFSQSGAVTQISASAHEVSLLASNNSAKFSSVSESVSGIGSLIGLCTENLEELEVSLKNGARENQEIVGMLLEITSKLESLSELFVQVESKAQVINDIVFQTKLLSFNASVEAARAGEHGKGFAVVAEEIGNLAQGSGESAISIQETLNSTKTMVEDIVKEISIKGSEVKGKIEAHTKIGLEGVASFRQDFEKVKLGAASIEEEIQSATAAMGEQAKALQEINEGTLDVSESVQRNTLVVDQTHRLAKELEKELSGFDRTLVEAGVSMEVKIDIIPWRKEYEIGIADMDSEHKGILKRINTLITAMNEGDEKLLLNPFEDLAEYTIEHFRREEAFMESFGYPSLESHKKVHENLLAVLGGFGEKIKNGELDKPKLASFLKNWLFTHIMGVDTKYAHDHKEKNIRRIA